MIAIPFRIRILISPPWTECLRCIVPAVRQKVVLGPPLARFQERETTFLPAFTAFIMPAANHATLRSIL